MAVLVDMKERLKLTLLTLDYCGKQEVYAGQEFPTGTVACDVLNIPEVIVNRVVILTDPMMKFVDALYHDRVDLLLMEQSRKNVFSVVELLKTIPPFSYQEYEWLDQKLASIFSPEAARKAARQMRKPNDFCNLFVQSLCLTAQLGFAIQRYQQALIPLVESLDDTELTRDAEGYAKQFAKFFTADDYTEDKWMSLANVSVQYLASETGLTRRMHYASFPSMFRANLFEALCVGHAPKKCPICGKFFLTTNARQQKYCNGLAPDDTFGRTCRQVGARLGREARELAADDPRKIRCKQAIDAIDQRRHRGTISQELAEQMKELARNHRDRAIMDSDYANGKYLEDMELTAAVYAQSHENTDAALESFMQRTHCTLETAKQYLKAARGIRTRQNEFFINEDGEETEDEILIDNSWNYSELIWDGIRSSAIQDAFWKLRHRDQQLLERRNAICMQCRRIGRPSQRQSYEQLSALIQASTDKGTEKAYNSAVKKFEKKLIERGAVRLVKLKCISKTMGEEKIANATYRYQADCDGEWGEIYLDFEKHKGAIRKLADWDTTISHIYAYEAIRYLFRCFKDKLPEQATVPFDLG